MRRTATSAAFCVTGWDCCPRHEVVMAGTSLDKPGHDDAVARDARSLLPLALYLALFLLVHFLNLGIRIVLPGGLGGRGRRGIGVGQGVLVRRAGARGRGWRRRVVLGEHACGRQKKGARQRNCERPLKYGSSICSCQIDGNGAKPLCVPERDRLLSRSFLIEHGLFGKPVSTFPDQALTPPIAYRAEGCGCAFRSRRRWHSSAPARTAGHRARRLRSAAYRVRAARCRRWSPAGIHPS
ncbi:hypothetical protein ACVWW3_003981 [Bradyrhizobium sp. LM2.9]